MTGPNKKKAKNQRVKWILSPSLVAGVDEVGRGPLAGSVVAAAVILNPKRRIPGLNDSKMLSEKQREALFPRIQERAIAWAIGQADVKEIDSLNIFHAGLLAMQRAIIALTPQPELVMVDGLHCPETPYPAEAIVEGDKKIAAISAASILAKVTRDREMTKLEEQYPGYGFAQHKGYSTRQHLLALQKLGPSPLHRRSFFRVQQALSLTMPLEDCLINAEEEAELSQV